MKSFFFTLFLIIFLIPAALSSTEYIVTENDINIRADSTVLSTSLGKLSKDEEVIVLSQRYEWCKILLPKRIPAYVWAEYIEQASPRRGEVTANALNLRYLPSLQSNTIGKIYQGDDVEILAKDDQWLKIKAYPNAFGWVHKRFLSKASNDKDYRADNDRSALKLDEIKEISHEISLTSFVANILPRLANPNMKRKEIFHKELLNKGEYVIPLLEAYIPSSDKNTAYSIIYIFSKLGRQNPILVSYFLKKVNTSNVLRAGIYLDIVQNILQIKDLKIAFYHKANEDKLLLNEIIEAKQKFEDMYQDKLIQDIKDSL